MFFFNVYWDIKSYWNIKKSFAKEYSSNVSLFKCSRFKCASYLCLWYPIFAFYANICLDIRKNCSLKRRRFFNSSFCREHLENLYNEIQQLNFFQKLLLNLGILVIPYLALELLMHWLYIFNGDNPWCI